MRWNKIGIDEIRTDEKGRDENFRQIANNTENDVIIVLLCSYSMYESVEN